MDNSDNERARQRQLDVFRMVDTLPEAAYDDIVRLASILCDVPMALVSLVDRDRQWFKAAIGLDARETSRDIAFCDHAIRTPDRLMEIADTHKDSRFVDNPLVTGDLALRFYAGMPLVTPAGVAVGTVCVLDRKPRELSERQREALASLARLTIKLMEGGQREHDDERTAMLEKMAPAPTVASADAGCHCTVAILELQDYAGAVSRVGERAMERLLQQFDHAVDSKLLKTRGDCANRSSGSPEMIVVVGAADADVTLQMVSHVVLEFEGRTGLRVVTGSAAAKSANEPLPMVFLRADEALTDRKTAYRAAA